MAVVGWLRDLAVRLQSRISIVMLAAIAGIVFMVGVVGTLSLDRSRSDDLTTTTTVTTTTTTTVQTTGTSSPVVDSPPRGIEGFGETALTVVTVTGESKKFCAALAESMTQKAQGMMHQDNFGGYDAMVFPFPADSTVQFYMANVRIPLSIAFVDSDGRFVSASEMPVCTVQESRCPRYAATRPFRLAIEAPSGGLAALQIGEGSTVTASGPCGV